MKVYFPGQRYNIPISASASRREQRVVGDGRHFGVSTRSHHSRRRPASQVCVQDSAHAQCGRCN